jgi:hypothetical protein
VRRAELNCTVWAQDEHKDGGKQCDDVAELRGNVVGLMLLRESPRPKSKNWGKWLVINWIRLGGRRA